MDVCSCQRKQYSGKKTHQLTMSTSKNRDVFKVIKNLRGKLLQHRTKDCDLKLPPPVFSIFNLFRPKSPTDRPHSRKRKLTDMDSAFSNLGMQNKSRSFLTKLEECITTALEPVNVINKELHQQKILNKKLRQKLGQQDQAMSLIENLQKSIASLRRKLSQRLRRQVESLQSESVCLSNHDLMKNQVNMITKYLRKFHSHGTRPESHQRAVLEILAATVDTTKLKSFAYARFVILLVMLCSEVQKHNVNTENKQFYSA